MISFKIGVGLRDLKPQIVLALFIVEQEYDKFGATVTITSCNDSLHMTHSKHYEGYAVDIRTKGIGLARQLVEAITTKLGPLGYDVLFEDTGLDNEHCHIEYDPK